MPSKVKVSVSSVSVMSMNMTETIVKSGSKIVTGAREVMDSVVATAERLVMREELKTRSRMLAYGRVAAQVGRSTSWLRKFLRGGCRVDSFIASQFDALLMSGLEADLAKLTAELEVARQSHMGADNERVAEVEACIARAKALLSGDVE